MGNLLGPGSEKAAAEQGPDSKKARVEQGADSGSGAEQHGSWRKDESPKPPGEPKEALLADLAELSFEVSMMNGTQLTATASASGSVKQIKEAFEKQLELPAHGRLKLFCNGTVLLPSMPLSSLESSALFGAVSVEQAVDVLKQAASSYPAYADLMERAVTPIDGTVRTASTGEFPTILEVLEDLAGEPKELPCMKADGPGKLRFWGKKAELLLPSLNASPWKKALGKEQLEEVTIVASCNSDCFNRGLGFAIEASPLMESTVDAKGVPSYVYNGYGLNAGSDGEHSDGEDSETRGIPARLRRNVVKFHPGMHGGQLRVEGAGGWGNQSMGFTPASLREEDGGLHTLKLTVRTTGINTIQFREWSKQWTHKLFDGEHIPAVYGVADMGTYEKQGVVYGRFCLEAPA